MVFIVSNRHSQSRFFSLSIHAKASQRLTARAPTLTCSQTCALTRQTWTCCGVHSESLQVQLAPLQAPVETQTQVSGRFSWLQSKRDRLFCELPRSLDICKRVPARGDQLPAVCSQTATHEIIHIDPFRLSATLNPQEGNCAKFL